MCGNAQVSGDAWVYGKARVLGDATKVLTIAGLPWHVTVYDSEITIGCRCHTPTKWKAFTTLEISEMDEYALEFWGEYKDVILGLHEAFFGLFTSTNGENDNEL